MPKTKRKLNLSTAERARRRLQAKRNFGLIAKRKSNPRPRRIRRKRKTLNRSIAFSRSMPKRKKTRKSAAFLKNATMKRVMGGFAYGVVREPINQLVKRIPFVGGIGDEVALGILWILVSNNTSGMIKDLSDAGIVVEAHNLGRSMGGNLLSSFNLNGTATASTTSGTVIG